MCTCVLVGPAWACFTLQETEGNMMLRAKKFYSEFLLMLFWHSISGVSELSTRWALGFKFCTKVCRTVQVFLCLQVFFSSAVCHSLVSDTPAVSHGAGVGHNSRKRRPRSIVSGSSAQLRLKSSFIVQPRTSGCYSPYKHPLSSEPGSGSPRSFLCLVLVTRTVWESIYYFYYYYHQ